MTNMDNTKSPLGPSPTTAQPPPPTSYQEHVDDFGTVTIVEQFVPGVDRLLLDFDAQSGMPEMTLSHAVEQGSTAVMGNGRLMVILRGVTNVTTADVDLRLITERAIPADQPAMNTIDAFDPDLEEIELMYDPAVGTPVIEVCDFQDRTGAVIFFNGQPVVAVRGGQGLTPEDVVLVPRARSFAPS